MWVVKTRDTLEIMVSLVLFYTHDGVWFMERRLQTMLNVNAAFGMNNVKFVLLSLEGPDLYALAGGLGVRAKELSSCLASLGFETHLYFMGDPNLPAVEHHGNLVIHRWCQWLSALNPGGVYMGEAEKINDLANSWPKSVIDDVVAPGVANGVSTVFLIEEWQTVGAAINLAKALTERGLDDRAVILWNANNLYGFDRVNFEELNKAAVITTVSRYMKHRMWLWGVNPVVIHNGIPVRMLEPPAIRVVNGLREVFPNLLIAKVGRYDVDKRWVMAVAAVGEMKRRGMKPKLIARGGTEGHREAVLEEARRQGLSWAEIRLPNRADSQQILQELAKHQDADVIELCFFVSEEFINALYSGSDCVLANSGHEPFGLVGLEVMANGGVAFVGATGEDYAQTLINSLVVETENPCEIVECVLTLRRCPQLVRSIRDHARLTAATYVWECIAQDLFQKIRFVAAARGVYLGDPGENEDSEAKCG